MPGHLLPHVIVSPDFLLDRLYLKVQKIDAKARLSILDGFVAGRTTEIDHSNGEVVRLAGKKVARRRSTVRSSLW